MHVYPPINKSPYLTFIQREKIVGKGKIVKKITAGLSARHFARHFQHHEFRRGLLNRFQQTENKVDRPRSGRPRKNHVVIDFDAIDFFLVES